MDIDNLSSDEIEKLQAELAKRLNVKRLEERETFVSRVMSIANEAGYALNDVIEMLEGERKLDRAKYKHPTDDTLSWSGMGRMPQWLHDLIDQGHKREEFRVS